MDKQNNTITELTLGQMDKVNGGVGGVVGYSDSQVENIYNTGSVPPVAACPGSPDGKHQWTTANGHDFYCALCKLSKEDRFTGFR